MRHRLLIGDVRERLDSLEANSVHCVVTSPPYYGLRDYGTAGQIGLEPTLSAYIATLVDVFRRARRVLREDGTLWLNIGDSYNANGRKGNGTREGFKQGTNRASAAGVDDGRANDPTFKEKDLLMVPARLAIALQDDGWFLRSRIVWHKTAPMPESVTDRPTQAFEDVYLFAKRARYFYDAVAVAEPSVRGDANTGARNWRPGIDGNERIAAGQSESDRASGRNMRNVWTIGPDPYPDAHFATFPAEIPRRAIKAGTSERGACPRCGAPWRRDLEAPGWSPGCSCDAGDPEPCVVLDPFAGSGTVGEVCEQLERRAVLIELNPAYADLIERRVVGSSPMFATLARG